LWQPPGVYSDQVGEAVAFCGVIVIADAGILLFRGERHPIEMGSPFQIHL
jgi:hypothetical protein